MAFAFIVPALLSLAAPAAAMVTYDFTAFSSNTIFDGNSYSGGFRVTVASPLTSTTTIPFADLESCSFFGSVSGPLPCSDQRFNYSLSPDYFAVQFMGPAFAINYYFDFAAATTSGTYDTQLFGQTQRGVLITTVETGAVPEPGSWAMLIAGFGLVGAMRRRRQKQLA